MAIPIIIEVLLVLVCGMFVTISSLCFNPMTRVKTSRSMGFWLGLIMPSFYWIAFWNLGHVPALWPVIIVAVIGSYTSSAMAACLSGCIVSDMPKEKERPRPSRHEDNHYPGC